MVCEVLELPNFELSEIFSLYFSPETAFVCSLVYVGNTFCETNTSHLTSSSHQHWRLKHVHVSLLTPPPPGIKPFQCDRCGKKFTRAYSLKMHRLKHEGKRCFRCQICSATFTSFGEYKHHMRVSRHIIRKPRIYECKTCGAMFTNSGNLIVHLRSLNHEASELANYFQSR